MKRPRWRAVNLGGPRTIPRARSISSGVCAHFRARRTCLLNLHSISSAPGTPSLLLIQLLLQALHILRLAVVCALSVALGLQIALLQRAHPLFCLMCGERGEAEAEARGERDEIDMSASQDGRRHAHRALVRIIGLVWVARRLGEQDVSGVVAYPASVLRIKKRRCSSRVSLASASTATFTPLCTHCSNGLMRLLEALGLFRRSFGGHVVKRARG